VNVIGHAGNYRAQENGIEGRSWSSVWHHAAVPLQYSQLQEMGTGNDAALLLRFPHGIEHAPPQERPPCQSSPGMSAMLVSVAGIQRTLTMKPEGKVLVVGLGRWALKWVRNSSECTFSCA
jgi:hypothetical protein